MKELIKAIQPLALKWKASGHVQIINNGVIVDTCFGDANKSLGLAMTKETKFSFPVESTLLLDLAVIQLIEQKRIDIFGNIKQYLFDLLPTYDFTIQELLLSKTGLRNLYNELNLKQLKNPEYLALDLPDRQLIDYQQATMAISDQDYFEFLNSATPATKQRQSNRANDFVKRVLIERITGQDILTYWHKIFESVGATIEEGYQTKTISHGLLADGQSHVLTPHQNMVPCFTIGVDDLSRFFSALYHFKLISKKSLRFMLPKKEDERGISFYFEEGFLCSDFSFLRTYADSLYLAEHDLLIILTRNDLGNRVFTAKQTQSFFYDLISLIKEKLFVYHRPKLIPLSEKYIDDAINLDVLPEQYDYVYDGAATIAFCLTEKKSHPYVLVDNETVVGLCVLIWDKRENDYQISSVLIDKKYQNKGYGKKLIAEAIKILCARGAQTITIGVGKKNVAAYKVYLANGFKVKNVNIYEYDLEWTIN